MAEYKTSYEKEISEPISDAVKKRNEVLAKRSISFSRPFQVKTEK